MDLESISFAYLTNVLRLTPKRLEFIFSFYTTWEEAMLDNFSKLEHLKLTWLNKLESPTTIREKQQILTENLLKDDIKILTYLQPNYPKELTNLASFPLVLYYQGNLQALDHRPKITVVGSRMFGKYAESVLQKVLVETCKQGVGVVSGLALGIDGLSHKIALEEKSPTIGVVGSGLDDQNFYPTQNLALKKEIIKNEGLIISEYPPKTKATLYSFPERNRILAALTDLTWVVQAGLKSGSLITASVARDLGRNVATTPGSIFDPGLAGNLKLLKEGAQFISQPEDILQLLGLQKSNFSPVVKDLEFSTEEEKLVYQNLGLEGVEVGLISAKTKLGISQITTILSLLELAGLAKNQGENTWVKCG